MNVAIYARAASQSESRDSIDKQIKACMKFAEDNGHVVVGQYTDFGITCANTEQTEFTRMVNELESRNVQGVLVSSLDRFSRKRAEAVEVKEVIENFGIETISVMDSDMPDKVMRSLLDVYTQLAEKKRKAIRKRKPLIKAGA